MPTSTGTSNARRAALSAQAQKGWNNSQLATSTGVDPATVRDFLDGSRWPKPPTLAKLDAAFGWTPGTLAAIGEELIEGPGAEIVGAGADDEDSLLFRRPAGISDQEWRSMQERMRGGWEWELRQADLER